MIKKIIIGFLYMIAILLLIPGSLLVGFISLLKGFINKTYKREPVSIVLRHIQVEARTEEKI